MYLTRTNPRAEAVRRVVDRLASKTEHDDFEKDVQTLIDELQILTDQIHEVREIALRFNSRVELSKRAWTGNANGVPVVVIGDEQVTGKMAEELHKTFEAIRDLMSGTSKMLLTALGASLVVPTVHEGNDTVQ